MTAREGQQIGPYTLVRLLGRGGMGEVYLAVDVARQRQVALKLLPAHLAADPVYAQRFRTEARIAARLQEPHIVPIHDFGVIGDELFIDMRLVDGTDLRRTLDTQGRLDPQRAIAILSQIASALDAAHADGLVHRDVKPENVLLTGRDFAYLADFGIAHEAGSSHQTEAGSAIGSFRYMAPERFGEQEVTGAADIYSLGCVLFECLTGRPPFPGSDLSRLMRAHLMDPTPTLPQDGSLPPELNRVLATAMAKEQQHRYRTASAFLQDAAGALSATRMQPIQLGKFDRPTSASVTDAATVMRPLSPQGSPTTAGEQTQSAFVPGFNVPDHPPTQGGTRSSGRAVPLAILAVALLTVVAVAAYFLGAGGGHSTAAGAQSSSGPAAGSNPAGSNSGASNTQDNSGRTLRVGITYAPGSSIGSSGYNVFDSRVATYVAGQLHYGGVTFVPMEGDRRITALSSGDVDMVVATFTMTQQRAAQVTFAGPYMTAQLGVLVQPGSPIYALSDLAGRTVCKTSGTYTPEAVQAAVPTVSFTDAANLESCVDQVKAGNVDAALMDDTVLASYLTKPGYAGSVRLVETGVGQQNYGVGLPHGDHALCLKVKDALQSMFTSGEWSSAVTSSFGAEFTPAQPNLQDCP